MGEIFLDETGNGFMKNIVCIIVITFLGKVLGFLREVLLAGNFGTGYIVDVYIMSYTIPSILFGFLPALGVGYTPIYYSVESSKRDRFTTDAIISSIIISVLCSMACCIWSDEIVGIIAAGFRGRDRVLTIDFLRIVVWSVVLNTPIQIIVSYLNCKGLYVHSNVTNLVLSSTQCIFVILATKYYLWFLPLGIIFSYLLQFVLLIYFALSSGFRPSTGGVVTSDIKMLYKLAIPIFLSNILVDFSGFIDKFLASFLNEGSISALNYSYTIMTIFYALLTTVVITIYYPRIAKLIEENNISSVTRLSEKILIYMFIILIPVTAFCVIMSENIVFIVLQRGRFDSQSLNLTYIPFLVYMISLLFISARDFINRIFYGFKDTKSNLVYGMVTVIANFIISCLLIKRFGHIGLAIGTTASAIITFPLYIKKICYYLPDMRLKNVFAKGVLICLAAIPSLVIAGVINTVIDSTFEQGILYEILKCFLAFIASMTPFVLIMRKMEIEEMEDIIKMAQSYMTINGRRNKT